jgi:hypothetical protein
VGAWLFRGIPSLLYLFAIAAVVPIAVACLGFLGFAIFNPEKLQSEDYQLRHESLQLIQQKSGRLQVGPASLEAIANPATPLLQSGEPHT